MGSSEKIRLTSNPMVLTTGLSANLAGYFISTFHSGIPRARHFRHDPTPIPRGIFDGVQGGPESRDLLSERLARYNQGLGIAPYPHQFFLEPSGAGTGLLEGMRVLFGLRRSPIEPLPETFTLGDQFIDGAIRHHEGLPGG